METLMLTALAAEHGVPEPAARVDGNFPPCFPPGFFMKVRIRKLFTAARRQAPALVFLLAMTMQIAGPALHAGHGVSLTPLLASAPTMQSATTHAAADANHDRGGCLQCRLVSQLKSLSPKATLSCAPVLHTDWLVGTAGFAATAQAVLDAGSPRGPPLFV